MRKFFCPFLLFASLIAAEPVAALSFDEARHLLVRTGFGLASEADIKALMPLSHEQAVDKILGGTFTQPVTAVPTFRQHPTDRALVKNMDGETRKAHQVALRQDRNDLRFWWIREMLATHGDLSDKLADLEQRYDEKFRVVFDAIRQLMAQPALDEQRRQIGFSSDKGPSGR